MATLFGIVAAALVALAATSCASTGTTLVRPDRGGAHIIYRISEEQAFTTALEAYAALYPKQSVDDIVEGQRRGYNADERSWMDWWSHRLLVIPAIGTDGRGQEVKGYWYDYSGSGTLFPTEKRKTGLVESIRSRLDATGTATVVTNLRDGQYETDGRAYLGLKRDARDIKLGVRPPGARNAERLSELKTLRDRGLITEEEYQAKRRQILDRM
ncbi:MAG: SHOCT domain-containing protein [Candidatus Rokubacteria bacterium]|nr:SHOCT domain-containing protein [Candidatus Rokubacteria bacterium]